jgi:membrane associated rhomboid family serine protease
MSGEPIYDPLDHTPRESPWRTVTRWIIVINIVIFVLDWFVIRQGRALSVQAPNGELVQVTPLQPLLAYYGHFSVYFAISQHQVWRFLTYQFCHANIEHIVLNLFGLLMVGPLVERVMGKGKYIAFYLVCGCAGPAFHILLSRLEMAQLNPFTTLVGASASIYGVLVAAARIAPNDEVMLAFPPIDIKLKNFVLIMILLSVVAVAWNWQNAGGHAAHLGGTVAGWFLSRKYAESRGGPRLAV